jgi:hypothetical protein
MRVAFDIPSVDEKNFLTVVQVFAVVGLAIIPLLVQATQLEWTRWKVAVILLAAFAIMATLRQAQIVSRDERARDDRERERDKRHTQIESKMSQVLEAFQKPQPSVPAAAPLQAPSESSVTDPDIDGVLYRAVTSPRLAVPFKMLKEIYAIQGRTDEPTVDVDVLIEMYAVNASKNSVYIKGFELEYEIDGQKFSARPEKDFSLELADKRFEYCINETEDDKTQQPLSSLINYLLSEFKPRQNIEGWLRFLLHGNPEKIHSSSTKFSITIIDSLGNKHSISRASADKRAGQIEYCRAKD